MLSVLQGEKIKDAVTPGSHSTQGYTGVPGARFEGFECLCSTFILSKSGAHCFL